MPELPEVETARRGIEPHLVGKKIKAIDVRNGNLRWPVPVDAFNLLIGEKITSVERRGKYIKLLSKSGYMLIHLGMSGSLRILTEFQPPAKHDHIDLIMSNGTILRFNDPRRFGSWLFQAEPNSEHSLLVNLGPEPLENGFEARYLYNCSRKKTQSIKTFIMDSHVVVGVGNIYASESLFKSGIHPKKPAGKISLARYALLVDAIKAILQKAVDQGGTTLRDFTDSEGKPGYFKQQLMVYGREKEQCYVCHSMIKNIKLGQRSTFYCQECQK
jgi:formamidopyrimidine-DNA glycosylase